MIKTEKIDEKFKRTYSTEGYFIRKKGTEEIYSDAVDLIEKDWEYEETEEKIPQKEEKEEE